MWVSIWQCGQVGVLVGFPSISNISISFHNFFLAAHKILRSCVALQSSLNVSQQLVNANRFGVEKVWDVSWLKTLPACGHGIAETRSVQDA